MCSILGLSKSSYPRRHVAISHVSPSPSTHPPTHDPNRFPSFPQDTIPGSEFHLLANDGAETTGWALIEQCNSVSKTNTLWIVFRGTVNSVGGKRDALAFASPHSLEGKLACFGVHLGFQQQLQECVATMPKVRCMCTFVCCGRGPPVDSCRPSGGIFPVDEGGSAGVSVLCYILPDIICSVLRKSGNVTSVFPETYSVHLISV